MNGLRSMSKNLKKAEFQHPITHIESTSEITDIEAEMFVSSVVNSQSRKNCNISEQDRTRSGSNPSRLLPFRERKKSSEHLEFD